MMKSRSLILLFALQCILYSCSVGFVLRKRSAWDENSLAEALQVIERERRRLEVPQEDDVISPSWEHGDGEGGDDLLGSLLEGDGSLTDDDTDSPYPQYPLSDVYSDDDEGVENNVKSIDSPLEEKDELERILKPSEDEERFSVESSKKLKKKSLNNNDIDERQYDLDYKKRLYDPSQQDFGGYDKKSKDTDAYYLMGDKEVSNLLHQVEDVEKQVLEEEADEASDDSAATAEDDDENQDDMPSKDELENVLKDDDKSETATPASSTDDPPPKVITVTKTEEKEWPDIPAKGVSVTSESFMVQPEKNAVSGKYKRSGRSQDSTADDDISSINEDKSDLTEQRAVKMAQEFIRAYLKLEDAENNNLANALNLATLSQIQRTDKFIPQETAYLKKAILNEEMIQKLNSLMESEIRLNAEPSLEGTLETPENDILPALETPEDGDVPESDSSVNDYVIEAPDETSSNEKSLIRKRTDPDEMDLPEGVDEEDLKNLFKQYILRNAGRADDVSESAGKWYEQPVSTEQEGTSNEEFSDDDVLEPDNNTEDSNSLSPETEDEITDALAEYVEELKPSERHELTAAVEDKLAEETCPAVRKLTDNCAFMEKMKFSIDAEARNLCNRHQLCYACGGLYDRSRHDCDTGYLEEAEALCVREEDTEGCKEDAAGLFMMMAKVHTFTAPSDADNTCSSSCVMSYVFGDSSK